MDKKVTTSILLPCEMAMSFIIFLLFSFLVIPYLSNQACP